MGYKGGIEAERERCNEVLHKQAMCGFYCVSRLLCIPPGGSK